MNNNLTIFSQIINRINRNSFKNIIRVHESDKHSKGINSWTHLVSMLFLHFSRATSLREVTLGLLSTSGNLVHLGITEKCPTKSSLSYINKHRKSIIFEEFYYKLLDELSSKEKFTRPNKKLKLKKKIYLLDSTLVTLCSNLFPWANYSQTKGAIKLHTLLDYDGCLPKYIYLSDGKKADVTAARSIEIAPNTIVVADRGYECYDLFADWDKKKITFVVRVKETTGKISYEENKVSDKHPEITVDEKFLLENPALRKKYPKKLRHVFVYNDKNDVTLELVTNNFSWTAETISELYLSRWQIESFFKEIKTHLRIKTFVGTSANAVTIQIWTAMITMLILRYLKAISKYAWCLSNLIAFLRMNLFTKNDLKSWLDTPFKPPGEEIEIFQYKLF